jgi:hypothetical protein
MKVRKWAFYVLIAFVIVFVVQQPEEAAKLVKTTGETAGEWFSAASNAFVKFVRSLI